MLVLFGELSCSFHVIQESSGFACFEAMTIYNGTQFMVGFYGQMHLVRYLSDC